MAVKPIPDGYHSITPYLIVNGAAKALEFYAQAFGAQELMRMEMGGIIGHAEIQIGDSRIMLADEHPDMNALAPASAGSAGAGLCLYVENADEIVARAVQAGATIERPLQDQFYGDRSATLVDPFNHRWTIATHIEDITPEEMDLRMQSLRAQTATGA